MTHTMKISLNINGRDYAVEVEPRKTLADAIREDCDLTGTHVGCEHGVCGACTVVVDQVAVRSCLMFAVQADGKRIRTVEGLANGETLHPLQRAFIANHGLQCGFCTPGFLMLAVNVLETNPDITRRRNVERFVVESMSLHRVSQYREGREGCRVRNASGRRVLTDL